MPGFFPGRSGPISERSVPNIVWMFFVFPALLGGTFLAVMIGLAVKRGHSDPTSEWCGFVFFVLLVSCLVTALPAAGWQELARRRADNRPSNTPPGLKT